MKNIAAALVKAQKGFSPALKTSTNPHFKSRYADLSACVEAVIDSLNEAGIALIQRTHECESGVTVETVFVHESGEVFEAGKLHVPASKNDPQGYGSALTYARRYSLMAACGIAPEDDDGNAASKPKPSNVRPTAGVSDHLSEADKSWLEECAQRTEAAFKEGGVLAAIKVYDRFQLEDVLDNFETKTEADVYRWSLLDSKTRAAITKERNKPSLSEQA